MAARPHRFGLTWAEAEAVLGDQPLAARSKVEELAQEVQDWLDGNPTKRYARRCLVEQIAERLHAISGGEK